MLFSVQDGTGRELEEWLMLSRAGGTAMKVPRPYRTGGWCVIKRDALASMFSRQGLEFQTILEYGWSSLDDAIWHMLGLPT